MNEIIKNIEAAQLKENVPSFNVGDTVKVYNKIKEGCLLYELPIHVDGLKETAVLAATRKDKKMEQGQVKFVLMKGIGGSFIDHTVSDEEMLAGIREILK